MNMFSKSPEAKAADAERLQWSMQAECAVVMAKNSRWLLVRGLHPKRMAKVLRALATVRESRVCAGNGPTINSARCIRWRGVRGHSRSKKCRPEYPSRSWPVVA